uniref:Uncharacterized protein n=1 Tax=Plectus sambesii TaxID=2011161 RepID=A0A914WB59_9BILA
MERKERMHNCRVAESDEPVLAGQKAPICANQRGGGGPNKKDRREPCFAPGYTPHLFFPPPAAASGYSPYSTSIRFALQPPVADWTPPTTSAVNYRL